MIERASIIFANKKINGRNIRENLLKVNLPDTKEESNLLWEMTSEITELKIDESNAEKVVESMPHPNHYRKWFDYL